MTYDFAKYVATVVDYLDIDIALPGVMTYIWNRAAKCFEDGLFATECADILYEELGAVE